jgi:SpoVK/Ycf46/Vps4 family AAA+-type ATPase
VEWSLEGEKGQTYCPNCKDAHLRLDHVSYELVAGRIKASQDGKHVKIQEPSYAATVRYPKVIPSQYKGATLLTRTSSQVLKDEAWYVFAGRYLREDTFEPYYMFEIDTKRETALKFIDLKDHVPGWFGKSKFIDHPISIVVKEALVTHLEEIVKTLQKLQVSLTKQLPENRPKVNLDKKYSWDDVAGYAHVKATLKEALELPLKEPDLLLKYKVRPAKGILLFGPPGCGKTLIAKVVASSVGANFFSYKASDLLSSYYGASVKNVAKMFEEARQGAPAVIFIDEIDGLLTVRHAGTGDGSREDMKVVNEFLGQMDGLEALKGVVVLAATNRPDVLDPAVMRPGRFDHLLYIPPPDPEARKAILERHMHEVPSSGVDYERMASLTQGFSGADLENLVRRAKIMTVKDSIGPVEDRPVGMKDFLSALEQVRPSLTPEILAHFEAFQSSDRTRSASFIR